MRKEKVSNELSELLTVSKNKKFKMRQKESKRE